MRPISHEGIVVPLDRANVDTDQILPKQFLKSNRISGFGEHLFEDWRYTEDERGRVSKNPGFTLNEDRYRGASILLTRDNFGCGSSREHAVWALCQYGFRSIIAPSFADIFYGNAHNNGLLLVILSKQQIDDLFAYVQTTRGATLRLDLEQREVRTRSGKRLPFLNPGWHSGETQGLDIIARTLQVEAEIAAFEARQAQQGRPFFYCRESFDSFL